jgi:hypothetical protein
MLILWQVKAMKILLPVAIFVVALGAAAQSQAPQSIHITAIRDHIRTNDEPAFSSALHTRIYTGTIGNRTFTFEEAITMLSPPSHFEVGQDYEVTKVEDRIGKTLKIREHPDKKGRAQVEWLTVMSVSEKETTP